MRAELCFINRRTPVGPSTIRDPMPSPWATRRPRRSAPRARVRSPRCPGSRTPARAPGLARLPSPLSSLSLPLTKRSPGSPGKGQEHACGRGCARSQHPRNPGTRGGPEPPLCEPTGGGVTAPLDLPLGPPAPTCLQARLPPTPPRLYPASRQRVEQGPRGAHLALVPFPPALQDPGGLVSPPL